MSTTKKRRLPAEFTEAIAEALEPIWIRIDDEHDDVARELDLQLMRIDCARREWVAAHPDETPPPVPERLVRWLLNERDRLLSEVERLREENDFSRDDVRVNLVRGFEQEICDLRKECDAWMDSWSNAVNRAIDANADRERMREALELARQYFAGEAMPKKPALVEAIEQALGAGEGKQP